MLQPTQDSTSADPSLGKEAGRMAAVARCARYCSLAVSSVSPEGAAARTLSSDPGRVWMSAGGREANSDLSSSV